MLLIYQRSTVVVTLAKIILILIDENIALEVLNQSIARFLTINEKWLRNGGGDSWLRVWYQCGYPILFIEKNKKENTIILNAILNFNNSLNFIFYFSQLEDGFG